MTAPVAPEGDPQERLVLDASVRDDRYPVQEQVRSRGDLVRGRLAFSCGRHFCLGPRWPAWRARWG